MSPGRNAAKSSNLGEFRLELELAPPQVMPHRFSSVAGARPGRQRRLSLTAPSDAPARSGSREKESAAWARMQLNPRFMERQRP
jgi:hypothetical protein